MLWESNFLFFRFAQWSRSLTSRTTKNSRELVCLHLFVFVQLSTNPTLGCWVAILEFIFQKTIAHQLPTQKMFVAAQPRKVTHSRQIPSAQQNPNPPSTAVFNSDGTCGRQNESFQVSTGLRQTCQAHAGSCFFLHSKKPSQVVVEAIWHTCADTFSRCLLFLVHL